MQSTQPSIRSNSFTNTGYNVQSDVLHYLMLTCRGLHALLEALKPDVEDLNVQQRCINGLCTLAEELDITEPSLKVTAVYRGDWRLPYLAFPSDVCSTATVRFKMDDGTCIGEDRDFLSNKSEYFKNLLSGNFRESNQSEIRLLNVSGKSFKLLLSFLHSDFSLHRINRLYEVKLDELLDVIILANQYMLEDLYSFLMNCTIAFRLKHDTAPVIYQWSLESKTNILRNEVLEYVLASIVLTETKRFSMFKEFLQLEYWNCFVEDMRKLLTRRLF